MLAALPFRTQDYVPPKPKVGKIVLRRSWTVSHLLLPTIEVRGPPIEVKTIMRRDRLFSRLSGTYITINKRDGFVAEALRMLDYFGRDRRVYIWKDFLDPIRRLASSIRRRMRFPGYTEESWFAIFRFELSPYNPSTFVRRNEDQDAWETVEMPVYN
ncbi:hypothetical protein F4679DRAFT_525457 [Xylaria curta]|nr:hypothetical protein F4679DRAFT_525457 [Xylaria curta]